MATTDPSSYIRTRTMYFLFTIIEVDISVIFYIN